MLAGWTPLEWGPHRVWALSRPLKKTSPLAPTKPSRTALSGCRCQLAGQLTPLGGEVLKETPAPPGLLHLAQIVRIAPTAPRPYRRRHRTPAGANGSPPWRASPSLSALSSSESPLTGRRSPPSAREGSSDPPVPPPPSTAPHLAPWTRAGTQSDSGTWGGSAWLCGGSGRYHIWAFL